MSKDLYGDVTEVAERLREQGQPVWSQQLLDDIDVGSTGSEILMALNFHIGEILKLDLPVDRDLMDLMLSVRQSIKDRLGPTSA